MVRIRHTPTVRPTSGVSNVEEALRLQCLGSPGARLVQVCYVDHATPMFASPHIHLQCLFADRSRTPWFDVQDANVSDLQTAIDNSYGGSRVRLHLHEQGSESAAPNGGPADTKVVDALPRCELTEAGACRLAADGLDACPFCLDIYSEGDEVIFMPCGHIAHTSCQLRWLTNASTCPTCRFALPKAPTNQELERILAPAWREQKRIVEAKMSDQDAISSLMCQEAEEEEEPEEKEEEEETVDLNGGASSSGSVSPVTTSDALEATPPPTSRQPVTVSPPEERTTDRLRRRSVRAGLATVTRRLFHLTPRRDRVVANSSTA